MSFEREQVTIRLSADLKEVLRRQAEARGISLSALILLATEEYINFHELIVNSVPLYRKSITKSKARRERKEKMKKAEIINWVMLGTAALLVVANFTLLIRQMI